MTTLRSGAPLPTFESFNSARADEGQVGNSAIRLNASAHYTVPSASSLKELAGHAELVAQMMTKYAQGCRDAMKDLPAIEKLLEQFEKDTPGLDTVIHGVDTSALTGGLSMNQYDAKVAIEIMIQAPTKEELLAISPEICKALYKFGERAFFEAIEQGPTQALLQVFYVKISPFHH